MSDFIFCNNIISENLINNAFKDIYNEERYFTVFKSNKCFLSLTKNIYNGFDFYETEELVCAVLGGPVLNFTSNSFINKESSNDGTFAIYNRWKINKEIVWDTDLDGPYVIILFNKKSEELEIVTDIMSFIPIFYCNEESRVTITSHINIFTIIKKYELDYIAIADYIVNNVVTFPFTIIKNVTQIFPASEHNWCFNIKDLNYNYKTYWLPNEEQGNSKHDIGILTNRLQNGLIKYIKNLTEFDSNIAILMSGGEDSRVIAGILPKSKKIDGFMFSQSENEEVEIAKKVANINNINLIISKIEKTYFTDIIEKCSDLIGIGEDCYNVHAFGFHQTLNLKKYDIILGGFLADTFLKSLWAKQKRVNVLGFENRIFGCKNILIKSDRYISVLTNIIKKEILLSINERRETHFKLLKKYRPISANEWMGFWPMSMQRDIPNIHGHRRIIKNFEPYTCSEVIKVSALANQEQKLNRDLFRTAMKSFLKSSKWIPHNKGYLPYFSNFVNNYLIIPILKIIRKFKSNFSKTSINDTWIDFDNIYRNINVNKVANNYLKFIKEDNNKIFIFDDLNNILKEKQLNSIQKRNLIQLTYQLTKLKNKSKIVE